MMHQASITSGLNKDVSTHRLRPGAYWLCQVGGWTVTSAINVAWFSQFSPKFSALVTIYTWGSVTGALLSDRWRRFLGRHRWLDTGKRIRWAAIAMGILFLSGAQSILLAGGFIVLQPLGPVRDFDWLPNAMLWWSAIFTIWTALYALGRFLRRVDQLQAEALRHRVDAQEAELRALQAQVNPHFFFNSLNSVRALTFEEPLAAARMIDQISEMMRYSLHSAARDTVTLEQELDAVRCYLGIEQIRFEHRLRATIDVQQGLASLRIPPLALQTLVENAVKYGVEPSPAGSDIKIEARREEGMAILSVANTGTLATSAAGSGVGLENTRRRLQLLPAGGQLTLTDRDGWVVATLHIPDQARCVP